MNLPKSREVIYIAGPFTDPNPIQVARNCNSANELAIRVRAFGMVPFCPHTALAGSIVHTVEREPVFLLPQITWEKAMEECREFLSRADAVLMVGGWRNSKGATEERALALSLGLPVFDSFADLVAGALGLKQRRPA